MVSCQKGRRGTSAATRYLRSVHPIRSSLQSEIRTLSLAQWKGAQYEKVGGRMQQGVYAASGLGNEDRWWQVLIWQWAASAGGALGCPALGDRDEVGAGWRGKGRRFSKTANGIAGNCEGHLLGKSCKLGYTFCQMSRTFVTAFRSTTWWSTSAINDLVTPPTATRPNPLYDAKFADFLATQEADPRCGRLKLRDWLLTIVHNVLDIYFCWRIFLAVQT